MTCIYDSETFICPGRLLNRQYLLVTDGNLWHHERHFQVISKLQDSSYIYLVSRSQTLARRRLSIGDYKRREEGLEHFIDSR